MDLTLMRSAGEAYRTGFLADAVLESLARIERDEATASDMERFSDAKRMLRDAKAGYLLLERPQDQPLDTETLARPRSELSRALALAIDVWMGEHWRSQHPHFTISKDSVERELDEYIESLQALNAGTPLERVEGWKKTRDFFAGLIRLVVDRAEEYSTNDRSGPLWMA